MASPSLFSQPLEAPDANIVLVSFPILIGQMRQFHRFENPINNHGRPEAGTETQKEHPAAFVASEGLHGGVIDHLDRTPECLGEIKSNPAAAEIVRFVHRTPVDHGSRVTDGDDVVLPILHQALYISHHSSCRHGGAGGNPALLAL